MTTPDGPRPADRPTQPEDDATELSGTAEGRPTGTRDEDGLRAGVPHAAADTVAPEERGEEPAVEHAPGGDL